VTYHWVDCEAAFIAQRYDRIAGLIGLFDWLFFVPPHLRKRAAARLTLAAGGRVLEIGCGTGRNFSFLRDAVGPTGKIYGARHDGKRVTWHKNLTDTRLQITSFGTDSRGEILMPCGRCRQLLYEHGGPELLIDHRNGPTALRTLLPDAFGPDDLDAAQL